MCRNHVEEVISPISLKALSSEKVLTGHMKGLFKVFDINKPSCEVLSYELRYGGQRQRKPISAICALDKTNLNTIAFGCHTGDSAYLVDLRNPGK